jgi:putative NADH-flavin reductase
MSVFKKIAIVGGLGDLGKHVTAAILAEGDRFDLTLITRKSGQSQAPAGAKIVEVDNYNEIDGLTKALSGQDVLMSFHNTAAAPGGTIPFTFPLSIIIFAAFNEGSRILQIASQHTN